MSLLLVESRGDGKPLHSVEAFPVATTLLGLPLFFKGALPMELPQMKELAEMARQVTETRAMIPRILPARTQADGIAVRPLAAGVPFAGAAADRKGRVGPQNPQPNSASISAWLIMPLA